MYLITCYIYIRFANIIILLLGVIATTMNDSNIAPFEKILNKEDFKELKNNPSNKEIWDKSSQNIHIIDYA